MRILFVADVPADPNSGAAGTEFQTMMALRQLGHEVDTLWADAIPCRIAHPNLHYMIELPGAFARVIRRACRGQHYDVIHCNQPQAYLAAREHQALGRPGVFVNRSHGFESHMASVLNGWRQQWGITERHFPRNVPGALVDAAMRRHCRLIVHYADGLIVSSQADLSFILDRYSVTSNQVVCIAQAVPNSFLESPQQPLTSERLRNLLVIGPPRFWKGPDVLGPAVTTLMDRYPDLRMTWVCAKAERSDASGYLSGSARSRITFEDPMPQDKLLSLYDRHGIFLFPSLFEGFGKVFLEAMSRGLCVIASATGGMADVIKSEGDGILVPVGNVEALGLAVIRVIEEPVLADRLSAGARSVAKGYSWGRVARLTAEFYESLIRMRMR